MNYTPYTHNKELILNSCKVSAYGDSNVIHTLSKFSIGKTYSIDLKGKKEGLYIMTLTYSFKANTYTCKATVYFDGTKSYTCKVTDTDKACFDERIAAFDKLTKNLDPNKYLSNKGITYPTSGRNGYATHVSRWEEISDTIILKDDWTGEAKVFAICNYLRENYAYDQWVQDHTKYNTRQFYKNDHISDSSFMIGNHVGNCVDFTNVIIIMCRHHGIPCTSLDIKEHTWNLVYINDEWWELDMCALTKYRCDTEDYSKENWHEYDHDGLMWQRDFLTKQSHMTPEEVNQGPTTPYTATGQKNPLYF